MELSYDPENNVAYIRMRKRKGEVESIRLSDDLVVDLSPDGTVYGMELLNAKAQLSTGGTAKLRVVNEASGKTRELSLEID